MSYARRGREVNKALAMAHESPRHPLATPPWSANSDASVKKVRSSPERSQRPPMVTRMGRKHNNKDADSLARASETATHATQWNKVW